MRLLLLLLMLVAVLATQYFLRRSPSTKIDPIPTPVNPSVPLAREAEIPKESLCQTPFPSSLVTLGGTVVLTDPNESLCLLHINNGPAFAARVGEKVVQKKLEVLYIGRKKICLGTEKGDTYLLEAPLHTSPSDKKAMGEAIGIRQVKEFVYTVPRSLVDKELVNLNQLLSSATAVAKLDNGKFAGFELTSIEPGSLFFSLGLQPNDVLTGANQIQFKSLPDGLKAYQDLRRSNHIEIHISRQGKPQTLSFDIN
jgi:hypothetical protein